MLVGVDAMHVEGRSQRSPSPLRRPILSARTTTPTRAVEQIPSCVEYPSGPYGALCLHVCQQGSGKSIWSSLSSCSFAPSVPKLDSCRHKLGHVSFVPIQRQYDLFTVSSAPLWMGTKAIYGFRLRSIVCFPPSISVGPSDSAPEGGQSAKLAFLTKTDSRNPTLCRHRRHPIFLAGTLAKHQI